MGKDHFEDFMRKIGAAQRAMQGEDSGLKQYRIEVPDSVDVQAIRKSLRMTQEAFAETFGFALSALRHWERKDRQPGRTARILLKVIEFSPETVLKAIAKA